MTTKTNHKNNELTREVQLVTFFMMVALMFFIAGSLMSPGDMANATSGIGAWTVLCGIIYACFRIAVSEEFVRFGLPSKRAPIIAQYLLLAVGILLCASVIANIYEGFIYDKIMESYAGDYVMGWREKSQLNAGTVKNCRNIFFLLMAVALPVKLTYKWITSRISDDVALF